MSHTAKAGLWCFFGGIAAVCASKPGICGPSTRLGEVLFPVGFSAMFAGVILFLFLAARGIVRSVRSPHSE